MRRVFCMFALTVAFSVSVGLPLADAGLITVDSAPFTFAFSAVDASPNCWALESSGGNSDYTQGDFSLTPAPTGSKFSGAGPRFPGRVLTNGWGGQGVGNVDGFSMPIAANYHGSVPAGATNVRLTLELTNLSIYGAAWNEGSGYTTILAWNETGVQTSSATILKAVPESEDTVAASYTQLTWDPADSAVAYTPGADVTRSFDLGTAHLNMLDGLEVMGTVHLSYEIIPEPSAIIVLGSGVLTLLAYAWKKRK
jgi:hypothetical protein